MGERRRGWEFKMKKGEGDGEGRNGLEKAEGSVRRETIIPSHPEYQ